MNGFVQQANEIGGLGMVKAIMSAFDPSSVPVYAALADEFAVFDRWFASCPTSTQPNRLFVHSATAHGLSSNIRRYLVPGLPQKTIFDSIHEDGLSFGIYYQNIPAVLFYRSLRRLKYVNKFHSYKHAFKEHARSGTLPNYAVIEQHFFDTKGSPANDDHPSHDVSEGQKFIKEIYETLRASPQWNESALIITYDEHGGFYDHVPTPVEGVPSPDGIVGPAPFYFKFDRLGVRVPAILVSPWVQKGTVIHKPDGPTPTSEFEHSSIPATMKKLFNLTSDHLTKRDAWAGTFEKYFTIRNTPRTDCPEKLPEVKKTLRPFEPKEEVTLSEFQKEMMVLASQLYGVHPRRHLVEMVDRMSVGEASRYANEAVKVFLKNGRRKLQRLRQLRESNSKK
ncbi:Non-specific phospholipase C1 [Rhynchospora pubera]|uniref:Non-specific phospholipase C1 n=1 Tax=Rhynchospora pubera TaxID=906938 RepID=A0AAV8F9Q1_9POAL|nr:Non-specific phospholipase C1 [Rhynchospora pubera]